MRFASFLILFLYSIPLHASELDLTFQQIIPSISMIIIILLIIAISKFLISKYQASHISGIEIQNGKIKLNSESLDIYRIENMHNPIQIHSIELHSIKNISVTQNEQQKEYSYIIESNEDLIKVTFTHSDSINSLTKMIKQKLPNIHFKQEIMP